MKMLYLVRHAKSSWDDPDVRDLDRPLNERGKKDAPRMGKRLKERNVFPDVMITSPAARALATCREIARVLDFPEDKIRIDKRLYHAGSDQIMTVINEIKDLRDSEEVAMIFGHNPGLSDFASIFLQDDIEMPTCGVVAIQVRTDSWKDARPGAGKLVFFDFPKNKKV